MLDIVFLVNTYHVTDQDRYNRPVTLAPELYKAGRDLPRFHLIS
jgi:hypothetical protein